MQPQHLKECHVILKELILLNTRTKKDFRSDVIEFRVNMSTVAICPRAKETGSSK